MLAWSKSFSVGPAVLLSLANQYKFHIHYEFQSGLFLNRGQNQTGT
jgi:hypothetical protein